MRSATGWTWCSVFAMALVTAVAAGAAANQGAACDGDEFVRVRVERTEDGVRAEGRRGEETWRYDVRGVTPDGFIGPMVERGLLEDDQVAALSKVGEEVVTVQVCGGLAGELVRDLSRLVDVGVELVAVEPNERVDVVLTEASMRDVVAALQAVGLVRVEG